jgi:hypothetical protein
LRGGRCAGSKGGEKLKVEQRVARRGRRDAATLRQREWQQRRRAGPCQKGREVQAIVANIMNGGGGLPAGSGLLSGSGLLRRNCAGLGDVRVGMGHRPQLRDDERQGGNDCKTQPYTTIQSGQGSHLKSDAQDASTGCANTELLHTYRRAARPPPSRAVRAVAAKLRWDRQIALKLEPHLIDMRRQSQRFRPIRQK